MRSFVLIPNRTEKNATEWSKTRLRELLSGVEVEGDFGVTICVYIFCLFFLPFLPLLDQLLRKENARFPRSRPWMARQLQSNGCPRISPRSDLQDSFISLPPTYIFVLPHSSNRKAKLIFFYEFVIKLKWKGKILTPFLTTIGAAKDSTTASGTIEIPNLSEENDIDEIDVRFPSCSHNPR